MIMKSVSQEFAIFMALMINNDFNSRLSLYEVCGHQWMTEAEE